MKKTHGFGGLPAGRSGQDLASSDKKKLVIMGVILVFVTIAYFGSVLTKKSYEDQEVAKQEQQQPVEERIFIPEFDFAALNARIDDGEEGELRIEGSVLRELLDHASKLTDTQYDALDAVRLDAGSAGELLGSPAASRGRAVRARGTIESLIERETNDGRKHIEGRLALEDGSACYFAVSRLPVDGEGPASAGTFVRVDGLFMKAHRAETDDGIARGPLIVGRTAEFSYESVGDRVTAVPASVLALVEDDSVTAGPRGQSFTAFWTLLAYARDLEPGAVDWDAAPELTNEVLAEILKDGAPYRGKPFRIPVSVNMGTKQLGIDENPARLESITECWIGNNTWSAGNGLIHCNGPFPKPDLKLKNLVTARGFFFRNHLYAPRDGGAAIAPMFVLADIERFVPAEDTRVTTIFAVVVGGTLALLGLLAVLLVRDKRKSAELQADLVRRRRERRARQAAQGTPSPGQT